MIFIVILPLSIVGRGGKPGGRSGAGPGTAPLAHPGCLANLKKR
jgi:hypothetical protein